MTGQFTIHNSQFTTNSQSSAISCKLLVENLLNAVNCKLIIAFEGGF
jgi:hypothetical protein